MWWRRNFRRPWWFLSHVLKSECHWPSCNERYYCFILMYFSNCVPVQLTFSLHSDNKGIKSSIFDFCEKSQVLRSKYSVKFLVQLIFFLLFNNERLCKLFWEHLTWFRIFSTIVTCDFLSVFRSQKFKALWLERIKKSIYIVLIYETNRFSVILFSSQSWSTRLYAHITFSILILTNWQKKKEKKLKIGFVFLFSPKNYCQNCILLVHSHQNEENYCHFETYLCKYFSFVYCFLASADYDFFPTVSAFHLGADHLTLEGGDGWFLVIKNFFS